MTQASPGNLSTYHQISKEGAAICNKARAAASQRYDRDMEPHRKALDAAWNTDAYLAVFRQYNEAMITLDGRQDTALAKANRAYDKLMKEAWNKYILGREESTQTRQLVLWVEVQG
jgi:hypothetical protein